MRLAPELAFGANFAGHARYLRRKRVQLVDHGVDGVFQLKNLALHVDSDLAREVAARHRRSHFGDVADLSRQVSGHRIDAVGKILPRAGDARHVRLAAEPTFRSHLACHTGHLGGKSIKLIDHGVDGLFKPQNLRPAHPR